MKKATAADLCFIILVWLASIYIVNPAGNFPLNDDWSFAKTVEIFIETGIFHPGGWTAMPLLTNVLWGALFCIPLDFSFESLRISTLTIALAGIVATYMLVSETGASRAASLIAGFTVGFGPIYYALSYTFMTDVPFTAICTISTLLFVRHLENNSKSTYILAIVFAVLATLSRQLALFVPIAFALTYLITYKISLKGIATALLPIIACVSSLLILRHWLEITDRIPELYDSSNGKIIASLTSNSWIFRAANNGYVMLHYLGLLISPIAILLAKSIIKTKADIATIISISTLLAIMAVVNFQFTGQSLMPLSENILVKSGVGPHTLHDAFILGINKPKELPPAFWILTTFVSFSGAAILLFTLLKNIILSAQYLCNRQHSTKENIRLFLLLSLIIYLFPVIITGYFDRYLIPILPILAALFACTNNNEDKINTAINTYLSVSFIVMFAIISTLSTRDFLNWNRLRWEAIEYLTTIKHIDKKEIDGGFEFNGLNHYKEHFKQDPRKSWWWVYNDIYRIGFGENQDYKIIKEYPFRQWHQENEERVVINKKI